jgi:hypothetical protein
VPLIVTDVPEAPAVGVKPVLVGGAVVSSVNCCVLVAAPPGEETKIAPLTAPEAGTVTTSCVVLAEVTLAWVPPDPPKRTVF